MGRAAAWGGSEGAWARDDQRGLPDAVVALTVLSENGDSTAIALVGNEGLVGIESLIDGAMPHYAVVQCAGEGFRLKAQVMLEEFARSRPARLVLLRNIDALMMQIQQTAVCNRQHSIDQQLCRLLLTCMDRRQDNVITMTQEQLADMLGVRRESVTEHAHQLRDAGLIDGSRGHITILDRRGLERRSCECYAVLGKELDRLPAGRLVVQRRPIERESPVAATTLAAAV